MLLGVGDSNISDELTATLARFPFPVSVSSQAIHVAENEFRSVAAELVLLILAPPAASEKCSEESPEHSSGSFIIYAQSREAFLHAIRDIGMPTVPPMMRPPFGNMLPDVVVSDAGMRGLGLGSFRMGAYLNADWSLSQRMMFVK